MCISVGQGLSLYLTDASGIGSMINNKTRLDKNIVKGII